MEKETIFKNIEDRHTIGQHSLLGPFHALFFKALRCEWGGKCKHCTYWLDNTRNIEIATDVNQQLINQVDFVHPTVGLFPSASFFDIPEASIRELFVNYVPENLISESTWTKRKKFVEAEILIKSLSLGKTKFWHKMGVESFDNQTRYAIGKKYDIDDPKEILRYTKSVILLVGTKYHTPEITDSDIEFALEHFDMIDVNVIDDHFSREPMASEKMIDYTLSKWGDTLNNLKKVELTLSPSSPWNTKIGVK